MLRILLARLQQGHRTIPFPKGEPVPTVSAAPPPSIPQMHRLLPRVHRRVPGDAMSVDERAADGSGKCLFCTDCMNACPKGRPYRTDYSLAANSREDLVIRQVTSGRRLDAKMRKLFGRSLNCGR